MKFSIQNISSEKLGEALVAALGDAGHEAGSVKDSEATIIGLGPRIGIADSLSVTQDQWEECVARITTAFQAARDHVAALRDRGSSGRIVFLADPSSVRPVEGDLLASVPGAFAMTLSQVAAVEAADLGVTSNVVVAGWSDEAPPGLAEGAATERAVSHEEVAGACAYLLSDSARSITGTSLVVDGGFVVTKAGGGSPLIRR